MTARRSLVPIVLLVLAAPVLAQDREVVEAVDRGLDWLARHQGSEGLWDSYDFKDVCGDPGCTGRGSEWCDVGLTGLAALAHLAAGNTSDAGTHADVVRKALGGLVAAQDAEGCLGKREGHFLYNHAIGTLCLASYYGATRADALREPTARAVAFLLAAQNPGMGWRYKVKPGDNDTSVTGWALKALYAAKAAGLEVPAAALEGARNWIESVTDGATFRTGYIERGDTGARLGSLFGKFAPVETCSAIALWSTLRMGADRADPRVAGQVALLAAQRPDWNPTGGPGGTSRIDLYYWYFGTEAFRHLGGDRWRDWKVEAKKALVPLQIREGHPAGSWEPIDAWGSEGGRLYATAISVLILARTEAEHFHLRVLEGALGAAPEDRARELHLCHAYLEIGLDREAAERIEGLLEKDGQVPAEVALEFTFLLGEIRSRQGDPRAARRSFEKLARLDPEDARGLVRRSYVVLLDAYRAKGDAADVKRIASEFRRKYDDDATRALADWYVLRTLVDPLLAAQAKNPGAVKKAVPAVKKEIEDHLREYPASPKAKELRDLLGARPFAGS